MIIEFRKRGTTFEGPPITMEDILKILAKTKPSVSADDLVRFEQWRTGRE